MRVLAGDIGGTHARLAMVDIDDQQVRLVREARYPSADYPSLSPIVRRFLDEGTESPARAAFGVAGPVADGRTATPNLPWTLDERTRRVVAADSPFPPPRRLTITPPVIAAARQTAMIVAAGDKAGIVQRALEGPRDPHALPSQLALGGVWILDRDSASKLTPVPA